MMEVICYSSKSNLNNISLFLFSHLQLPMEREVKVPLAP